MDKIIQHKLYDLGYLAQIGDSPSKQKEALALFQHSCEPQYKDGPGILRSSTGEIDVDTIKLLNMPRCCSVPDIPRNEAREIIEEARFPDSCSREVRVSHEFAKAPGLTNLQTTVGWLFALAQWNTVFDSPLNSRMFPELVKEFWRLAEGWDVPKEDLINFVLWGGTITHEDGHALGLQHTPNDPQSVMYPQMRGQLFLNRTDLNALKRNNYSANSLKMQLVRWQGNGRTQIWARLKSLPGPTLAWSMLNNGSCGGHEQAYDSTINWNSGQFTIPKPIDTPTPGPIPGPSPIPPSPGDDWLSNTRKIETRFYGDSDQLLKKVISIPTVFGDN